MSKSNSEFRMQNRKKQDVPKLELAERETREGIICSPAFLKYYNKLKEEKPFFMSEGDAKSFGLNLSKVEFKQDGNI